MWNDGDSSEHYESRHMVSPSSMFTLVPEEISHPEAQHQPRCHLALP